MAVLYYIIYDCNRKYNTAGFLAKIVEIYKNVRKIARK